MPADMGGRRQLEWSKAISEQAQQQTEQAASSKTKTTSIEEIHAGNFAERLMRSPRSKPGESIFLSSLPSSITIALYMKTDLENISIDIIMIDVHLLNINSTCFAKVWLQDFGK